MCCFPRSRPYNKCMTSFPVKRNTLVLCAVLVILAVLGWAGWANWEYRKQAEEMRAAAAAKGAMLPGEGDSSIVYVSPLKGKPAPTFTLTTVDGKKVSLVDYKGKALLLNFWATWCAPCKLETPWIVELRNKYAAQGFEVLGIDTEGDDVSLSDKAGWAKDKSAVADFSKQMKVPYPMLMGGDSISKAYGGLDSLPTSFFVDRKGTVVAAQVGLTSESEIESNIKKALAN